MLFYEESSTSLKYITVFYVFDDYTVSKYRVKYGVMKMYVTRSCITSETLYATTQR